MPRIRQSRKVAPVPLTDPNWAIDRLQPVKWMPTSSDRPKSAAARSIVGERQVGEVVAAKVGLPAVPPPGSTARSRDRRARSAAAGRVAPARRGISASGRVATARRWFRRTSAAFRSPPSSSVPTRLAPRSIAPCSTEPERFVPVRSAPSNCTPRRMQLERSAPASWGSAQDRAGQVGRRDRLVAEPRPPTGRRSSARSRRSRPPSPSFRRIRAPPRRRLIRSPLRASVFLRTALSRFVPRITAPRRSARRDPPGACRFAAGRRRNRLARTSTAPLKSAW